MTARTIELCRWLTLFWPLYEVVHGKVRITYKPRQKKPVVDFLRAQGRFRHLFQKENQSVIEDIQREVDRKWEALLAEEAIAKAG